MRKITALAHWRQGVSAIALLAAFGIGTAMAQTAPAGGGATGQLAQATQTYRLDIPAKPLLAALADFTAVTGVQIVRPNDGISGTAPAVSGTYTADEALRRLLSGSGITWRFTDGRTVVLEKTNLRSGAGGTTTMLDQITVVANRSETPIGEATASASVIDRADLDYRNVHRMQDITRYEPGVTVTNDPTRTGAGGYNIRGLQDNRVLMMIDGTRLPDMPGGVMLRGGGYTPYTRDMVDLDTLKRVEILRGPGSALYGSDALAGVVGYVTKSPEDYLRPGKDAGGAFKMGYDGIDDSISETATAAMRAGDFSVLGMYTRRDGHEGDSTYRGNNNAQDYYGNNALGKLVYNNGRDRFGLTGEFFQRQYDTEIYSERTATYLDSDGDDHLNRYRLSLEHSHDEPVGFIDRIDWKAYFTQLDREEVRRRQRTAGQSEVYKQSNDQNVYGLDVQLASETGWGGVPNQLTYGVSGSYTETERLREYTRYTAAGTVFSNTTPDGAPTPSRYFPNTETFQGGIFGQDEIKLGQLTVTPGLRFDYYKMTPNVDSYYLRNPSSTRAREIEEYAVSPKLGMLYQFNETYSVFGQYAHGFRAPPYDDANTGFRNSVGITYEFLPNPNLKAETSNGIELGFRGKYANGSSFQTSGFFNRYHDYIDMKTLVEPVGATVGQYQAINVSSVDIYGTEARGEYRFHRDWGVTGSFAYLESENRTNGKPIDSVPPLTLMAGLNYMAPGDAWGARLDAKRVYSHDEVSDARYYRTAPFTTVDFNTYYDPFDWLSFSAGVSNIFDEKYINYVDVLRLNRTASAGQTQTDFGRFQAAGRTFALSATVKW